MDMGFSTVYRCLEELFPQIDPRLLKAVAYEHKEDADADAAVEVVLSEILPSMMESTKLPSDGVVLIGSSDDEAHGEEESLSLRRHRAEERLQGSHVGTTSALPCSNYMTSHAGSSDYHASPLIDIEAFWDKEHDTSTIGDPFARKEAEETVVQLEKISGDQSNTSVPLDGAAVFDELNANNADSEELILLGLTGKTGGTTERFLIDLNEKDHDESESTMISNESPAYDHSILISENDLEHKTNTSHEIVNLVYQQPPDDLEHKTNTSHEIVNLVYQQPPDDLEHKTNTSHEIVNLVYQQLPDVQEDHMQTFHEEANDNLVESLSILEKTHQEPLSWENVMHHHDDNTDAALFMRRPENEIARDTNLTRSAHNVEVDCLDRIIDDAKNNKRTLFAALESVMDSMKEVEAQEIAAEKAKEEAAVAGLNIYSKVEELNTTLARAKEANDMHAGEVYGERAILATEVRELQSRLFCLSDERDLSLTILDEMRAGLETRLAAAEKLRQDSEHEKHAKEGFARRALMEQEALMEKVVQESKKLQEEAEENNKLREFLVDRGRIVDALQGEISVICQDVKQLQEKFASGVSLSKSISASQTTCILASSSSSMESSHSERGQLISKTTPKEPSPSHSVNSSPRWTFKEDAPARMGQKAEEGWELCGDDDDYDMGY